MSKKIAVLCLSHNEGGMEIDAIKYTQHFQEFGYDCSLICRQSTFLEQQAYNNSIECHAIDFKRKLDLKLIIGLRKIIQSESIETIIFFGTSEIKSIFFAILGSNCKVILRHGTTMSSPKKDPIHKLFYTCVDTFVGISQHLGRNISDIFPGKNKNIKVIYNFIEKPTEISKTRKNQFLFVGRVDAGKGVEDAILALGKASITTEQKHLTLVGKSQKEYTEKLKNIAQEAGVSVTFSGFTSSPNKAYNQYSHFLFPSHGEGLGNVTLEALSHELTCICYDNTVFPELQSLGFESLYLAKHRDINDLATTIENCINLPFSRNDKNVIQSNFCKESSIEQWKKIL